jgi:hypothetical protein
MAEHEASPLAGLRRRKVIVPDRGARPLTKSIVYSKMLYMIQKPNKVRMTFRLEPQLAEALKQLGNQTLFVETALAEALGETCPLCQGRGRVPARRLRISDFKTLGLPRLRRHSALKLREIVRLGQRLLATDLELATGEKSGGGVAFRLRRHEETLLSGNIAGRGPSDLTLHN